MSITAAIAGADAGATGDPANAAALFGTKRQWLRNGLVAAASGLFLGAIGPFGSYLNPSRALVLAYWVGTVLLGELLYGLIVRPARVLAPRWKLPQIPVLVAATASMAVPLSLICHAAAMALWPGPIGRIALLTWYGQTLAISAGRALIHAGASSRRVAAAAASSPMPAAQDFLSRLPAHLGRELLALQMEDHYVRAHTRLGSALILIPLHQALRELANIPGMKVHRSWWVATGAMTATVQDGRNMRLRLINGLQAPVSRSHVVAVKAARAT